jgi:hypothetical protein
MKQTRYTIAIIDEEQKERDKFIRFFEDDFNVVEITKLSNSNELLRNVFEKQIDAVAIDYKLKEHGSKFKTNGDSLFKQLTESLTDYPSFVITNNASHAKKQSQKINPLFILDKSKLNSIGNERKEFISEILTIIRVYKDKLQDQSQKLEKLTLLKQKGKMSDKQENEFLRLNYDVSKSVIGKAEVPLKYFSRDTNKKLDEIIRKTNTLIKKIEKKKS